MASKKPPTNQPIKVGDRFEDMDYRNAGRVVEVEYAFGVKESTKRFLDIYHEKHGTVHPKEETILQKGTQFHVRTESHPKNPGAIGRVSRISEYSLRNRYERNSR